MPNGDGCHRQDVVVLLPWVVLYGWCLLVLEHVKNLLFSINESKRKAFVFSRKRAGCAYIQQSWKRPGRSDVLIGACFLANKQGEQSMECGRPHLTYWCTQTIRGDMYPRIHNLRYKPIKHMENSICYNDLSKHNFVVAIFYNIEQDPQFKTEVSSQHVE